MRVMLNRSLCRMLIGVYLGGLALAGCGPVAGLEYDTPGGTKTESTVGQAKQKSGTGLFGGGGLSLFGGDDDAAQGVGAPIPVNSYLWRATLDTLSFMPLASADPFGGVIITDWFTPPESANERFKMTVYILSRDLRSDGVRVAVFRQHNDGSGNWVDGKVNAETASELENAILTRARELRVAGLAE